MTVSRLWDTQIKIKKYLTMSSSDNKLAERTDLQRACGSFHTLKDMGGPTHLFAYRQRLYIDADTREWSLDGQRGVIGRYASRRDCQSFIRSLMDKADSIISKE